jgi:Spy/CpxP family protein refolding chaperone
MIKPDRQSPTRNRTRTTVTAAALLAGSAVALGIMADKSGDDIKHMKPGIVRMLDFNAQQNLSPVNQAPQDGETLSQLHEAGRAEAHTISAPLEHKIAVHRAETIALGVDVALLGGLAVGVAASSIGRREQ